MFEVCLKYLNLGEDLRSYFWIDEGAEEWLGITWGETDSSILNVVLFLLLVQIALFWKQFCLSSNNIDQFQRQVNNYIYVNYLWLMIYMIVQLFSMISINYTITIFINIYILEGVFGCVFIV